MKKNNETRSIEIDPISGEYYLTIPEWIINDLSWYEDTEIQFSLDGTYVVLNEKE
jgi:hypothetical protein